MADLFISYSRKDIAYAKILHEALKEHDLETWIDWQDIPPTVEWLDEVYSAIEQANTFIFILSATSALSKICSLEIDHARKNNKRIIPIVINDVEPSKVHPALAAINWIFSRSKDELQPAIANLIEAIQTDYDWVKAHTRLQMRALEWERADHDKSFLLQGTDLHQAENWLAEAPEKEPEPTLTQTRYIQFSRQEATKKQRRLLTSVGAALIVTVVLGVLALINGQRATQNAFSLATQVVVAEEQRGIAEEQESIAVENTRLAHIRELIAIGQLSGTRFDIAILSGIESYNSIDTYQTRSNLFRLAQLNPKVRKIMSNEGVRNISFSQDGKYLASAGDDGNIILWDAASGQPTGKVFSLKGYGASKVILFSPDGKILAAGDDDGTIILWDVASGQPYEQMGRHPRGEVISISFSPDGRILAAGGGVGENATIILWDIASMQPIGEPLQGFHAGGGYNNIHFSPDGKILVYTSGKENNSMIILWDVATGQPIGEPLQEHNNWIHDITFSPDGNILASAGEDQYIILWNVASRQPINKLFHGHSGGVLSISFSPDGNTLATSSRDRTITLWDAASGQPISKPLSVHHGEVTDVTFSPDGKTLASCSLDGTIILWDMAVEEFMDEQLEWEFTRLIYGMANNVAFSPDRKTLAIGYRDGTTILWDVASGQPLDGPLRGHNGNVTGVAFTPDGKTMASASLDGTIVLWDTASRQPLGDSLSAGDSERDLVLSFSPDGKILASTSVDSQVSIGGGTIILWDVASGQPLDEFLLTNIGRLTTLAFSPNGKILAAGGEGGTILWDVVNRQPLGDPLSGDPGWVDSLAFSPDGSILASGTDAAIISLWDVASRQPLGNPLGVHTTPVLSLAFSPDGAFLASTSMDGIIILWDAVSMQPLGEPLTVGDTERGSQIIAFSPDGKSLLSLRMDGSLTSWITDTKSWLDLLCERVGRNFTQNEWMEFFPGEPYRKTCEQWPEGT